MDDKKYTMSDPPEDGQNPLRDSQIAYDMENAYSTNSSREAAIDVVKKKWPHVDRDTLWLMWASIDACMDMFDL